MTDSAPIPDPLPTPGTPILFGVDAPRFSRMLGVAANALLLIFAAAMLRNILPLQLLVPTWQLRFTGAIVDNAIYPLLALVLLHLALYLDPGDRRLQNRFESFSRLAIPAALGFLLLIPLQASATWSGLEAASQAQQKQTQTIKNQFASVRLVINSARTAADLRAGLESLQRQPIASNAGTDFSQPLPQLRQTLLKRLDESEVRLLERLKASAPPLNRTSLLLANITAGISAIAYSLAFAAAGHRRDRELSLYDEWRMGWLQRRERSAQRRRQRIEQQEDLREIMEEEDQARRYEQIRQEQLRRSRREEGLGVETEDDLIP